MMRILLGLFFIVTLFSCTSVYVPNARNVPMLSQKGEVQGHFSFAPGYNHLQAAVAITDHFAMMANGMYADSKTYGYYGNSSSGTSVNKYTLGEFALGYYTNTSDRYYFDLFGGYGAGKSKATEPIFHMRPGPNSSNDFDLSSATYHRYFVQPSFGLKRKHFHGAIAFRISAVDFKKGISNGMSFDINQDPALFIEPAFVAKFPFEKFVLNVQAGLAAPLTNAGVYFDYEPLAVSVGIGFRLGYQPKKVD